MRRKGEGWALRVYLGRDSITGKPRYHSRTFRGTKRRAEEELARLLTGATSGADTRTTGQSFADLVDSSLLLVGGVDMATESERLGHGPTVALRSDARSNRDAHERAAEVVADALAALRSAAS